MIRRRRHRESIGIPTQCILSFPDPRLRTPALPVQQVTERIQRFADALLETMYAARGIGLAATQVNVHKRIIVVDVSEHGGAPHTFVNPVLTLSGATVAAEERCLSVPGVKVRVARRELAVVESLDRKENPRC